MILIGAIVIAIFVVAAGVILYIRQKGVNINGYTQKAPLFLSGEETIEFLGSRAKLDPEEKKMLEKLISIGGTNRLHAALDGAEVGRNWLMNTRRAIYSSLTLEDAEKETYEYYLYELFRKISIARVMLHPQLVHIKNIPQGQTLEIKMTNTPLVVGDMVSGNSKQVLIVLIEAQYRILQETYIPKAKVAVSFWKEMDAGYAFKGTVEYLSEKKGVYQLSIKVGTPLKRMKMRLYPRRDAEIPVRYKQEQGESFGRTALGMLNDVGPKGGILLTHSPVSTGSRLRLEFPVMGAVVQTMAVARSLRFYETIYSVGLEFPEISKEDAVRVYRFIYPEDTP